MHLALAVIPEAELVCALKAHSRGFLERTDAAVADSRVRHRDVLDQVFRPDQPAHAPAGGVEVFARGADGEGQVGDFGAQCGHSREWDVVEAVVDLQ